MIKVHNLFLFFFWYLTLYLPLVLFPCVFHFVHLLATENKYQKLSTATAFLAKLIKFHARNSVWY